MIRTRLLAAGAVAAAFTLSGCGFHGLYSAPLPGGANLGSHPYQVTAEFADVLDLVPQSAVKVNDIAIGKVTTIVLQGWHAKVTMEVNNSVNLPANARAEILQTSLLGEKYVALMQPTVTPAPTRLHNGSNIPLARTTSAPEVEQVLGALSLLLNEGGLNQIKQIANELNAALHGNESKIRDLLSQLNTFVGTLDNQKQEITTALQNIDVLARTLNRQKKILTSSLAIFPKALDVLANERNQFVRLLTSLSHLGAVAGGVIDATQQQFISSLKSLQPVLEKLTEAGSNLPEALKIMGTFPFPLGTSRTFVKGDYANLAAYINFDLSDTLCGIDNPKQDPKHLLCKLAHKLPLSARHQRVSTSTFGAQPLAPSLVGAGK
jgi:phospholipid/cholesterol/gamma-HCH transport system substrate-binding protein